MTLAFLKLLETKHLIKIIVAISAIIAERYFANTFIGSQTRRNEYFNLFLPSEKSEAELIVTRNSYKNSNSRIPRAIIKKKKGPIRQVFGIIYEQWNDTRNTFNTINTLLNENFLPENATTTTTTANPNPNPNDPTTKAPPFRITRSELSRILRRNLKGLIRLYNLEMADALKQSRITEREFKKNVSIEISKFL
ncbi:hypothetical protein ILUMI_06215 [Ignelater luminosus]|uniref:Uncharacterized protein n=1 Tax=Ignelater luminosus TaxID=2038154 RepID=A0A8K0DAF4_IGNLU|nr:hypothetical protein ILUMI_06215 [Ignelater luminosus]